MDDLVGAADIAERLGVDGRTIHQWHRRHDDFPEPLVRLRQGFVWAWPDVAKWARATGRLGKG